MSLTAHESQKRINLLTDTLLRSIHAQIPALGIRGTVITRELINQVTEIMRQNRMLLAGTVLAAGLLTLLPTLVAITVNIVGFTAGGVLHGTVLSTLTADIYKLT
jgi:hypothetical protein